MNRVIHSCKVNYKIELLNYNNLYIECLKKENNYLYCYYTYLKVLLMQLNKVSVYIYILYPMIIRLIR